MPTQEQIEKCIQDLKELKNCIPEKNYFGDNNHSAINAQIKVLELNATEDMIYETYPNSFQDFVRDNALYAWEWLNGGKLEEWMGEDWLVNEWKGLAS